MNAEMLFGLVIWTVILGYYFFSSEPIKFQGKELTNPLARALYGLLTGVLLMLLCIFFGAFGEAMLTPIRYMVTSITKTLGL